MSIDPAIKKALDETGLPYEIERGSKHRKIRLAGRLVGILSHSSYGTGQSRAIKNTVAQIRRIASEVGERS